MPQNKKILRTRDLLISPKTTQRHFLFTLHPLSMVIFATATVLAFVLLHNSNFNFHCYTQREATPTQKLAWKCAATSHDFFRERLQSAFALANQLRWIAQYTHNYNQCCSNAGDKMTVIITIIKGIIMTYFQLISNSPPQPPLHTHTTKANAALMLVTDYDDKYQ